jgi:hypothetical protein
MLGFVITGNNASVQPAAAQAPNLNNRTVVIMRLNYIIMDLEEI